MPANAFDRSVAAFRKTLDARAADAERALAEQRWDDAARAAHSLKGVSGNFGAARLTGISDVLETRLGEGDHAGAADLAGQLVEVARLTAAALDEALDRPSSG